MKVAQVMTRQRKNILGCSDQRLKQSNELLQGIKLLKLYAWEFLYCNSIEDVRKKELAVLRKINFALVVTMLLTNGTPILVTLVAFGTYTPLTGLPLTPDMTFSSLALFNQLALPLFILPMSLSMVVSAIVSTKRLRKFLLAPEVEGKEPGEMGEGQKPSKDAVVKFRKPGEVAISTTFSKYITIGIQTDDDTEPINNGDVIIDSNGNAGKTGAVNGGFTAPDEGN
ncbi:ATP-binding cassette sub-family C member 9-like [Acanthaster planci]|uniref:ATP-binding cassette sub-family C member 9-like n=1 Tax=Acanthaster planci TaxID=133434 RepID=A0A8B7ZJR6_ACAPL|nr:ATP-binding cassette sub-family C member 9-like [Acanthaster planci]